MTLAKITAADITNWDSLDDIAASLEKRGLERHPDLGNDNRIVLELADGEFMELVEAGAGKSATDYKPGSVTRHTNLVSTDDFETFTFITRQRDWDAHGRIKYQQFSFEKEQFRSETGEKNTVLQKLNEIEYGQSAAVMDDLYDTRQIVKEFYEQFEDLRTDLVQEVSGIPDDRGDAKGRYVQVLLDRMIFLYFIQEKNLLDYDAEYLHTHHQRVVDEGGDVYEDFYDPLFFEMLAEGKNDPEFGKLPYLNGGLFSKNPIEQEFEDAKLGEDATETNALFGRILDFLSDWNWNVDERLDIVDPKNLSPAVLGHIFEQTVNQKEMGAYYTPEEITGFMARRTIHPYLLDQLNEVEGTDYESIDDVFSLDISSADETSEGEAMADGGIVAHEVNTGAIEQDHVETLYFDVLKETRILDPAVGSGAFLLAAQEILLDAYLQCIEYFVAQEEDEPWELTDRIKDELDKIRDSNGSESLYAKRQAILSSLYGVDIDEGAVEICKLRLWLSMVSDIEDEPGEVNPLPNIDFNIRQGNSLIGYVETIEPDGADKKTPPENTVPTRVGDWSVRSKYQEISEAIQKHRQASTSEEATEHRREAEELIESYRDDFDQELLNEFHEAGLDEIGPDEIRDFSPLHWPLEFPYVWEDGRFDVVIGNPPWEVLKADNEDYFSQFDERFRTRMPEDKKQKQQELLEKETIERGWEEYKNKMEKRSEYFKSSDKYQLQQPKIAGRTAGNEIEMSALFLERVFKLARDDSRVSQILPGILFSGKLGKDLRMHLLNECSLNVMPTFENGNIFQDIDNRYKFGIVVFENFGWTDRVLSKHQNGDLTPLRNIDSQAAIVSRQVLEDYSSEARIFPYISSRVEAEVLEKILDHPPIGEAAGTDWYGNPFRELDHNNDGNRFIEDESEGEYPILGGGNVYQFSYDPSFTDIEPPKFWSVYQETDPEVSARMRVREKKVRELKKAIYGEFDGTGSQKGFVNDILEEHRGVPLQSSDVVLDCDYPRVGFRQIARSTDERTLIATLLPPEYMCDTTLQPIQLFEPRPATDDLSNDTLHSAYKRILSEKEQLAMLGMLNSIPFDFLMRTKVDVTVVMYKFEESQMPRLTDGDDWFHYISERAARLNCYGEEFAEMRERLSGIDPVQEEEKRRKLRAEIDAAALHAYGLNYEDAEFILDDFHRVRDPRLMDEDYFTLVLEKYEALSESGPQP